jgi:spore germination protein KB
MEVKDVLEKGRISARQMEMIIIPTVIATSILSSPAIATRFARHDMWMTPIIGSITGFVTVYITWKIHQLYPKMTPVQYSEKIIGKIAGRLFGLLLILFYLFKTGISVREYSDFIAGTVMLDTPRIVFTVSIIFVSALAARGGIEVIARSAVICTTLFMTTAIVLLLLIKDLDLGYLLPFLENGIAPVMKGAFLYHTWFTDFFLLAFLFPFINHPGKGLKSAMKTSLFVMAVFVVINFFVLTVIGTSSVNQFFPVYSIVRGIRVFEFFENFEVLITSSWVLGNFVKIAFFLYVISLGLGQLLRLSDYKVLVFPLGLLMVFFSYWDLPNIVVVRNYMNQVHPFIMTIIQFLIPLFLLVIALVRKRRRGSSG